MAQDNITREEQLLQMAELVQLTANAAKLAAEERKLSAEELKLDREAAKLSREFTWRQAATSAGVGVAAAVATALVQHWLGK